MLPEAPAMLPAPVPRQTTTRVKTLREVYEHQAGLVTDVSKGVARLRTDQEVVIEALEDGNRRADTYRVRMWHCV